MSLTTANQRRKVPPIRKQCQILTLSGGPLYPLCWSKAATATISSRFFLLGGETPQRISTTYSGRSGFRSTQGIQGTTACRYNTFILNCMANPMIYRGHCKFPYISLYLEFPHPSPPSLGRLMVIWRHPTFIHSTMEGDSKAIEG